jgi:hypothetical protein
LISIGFAPSQIDECVFFRGNTIFLCYVDDGIFASSSKEEVNQAIKDLRRANFDIEDKGDIEDYLGINVEKLSDGRIKISQPQIIDSIIAEVPIASHLKNKSTPADVTKQVIRDVDAPKFNNRFHYRRVIGKLNYLEKGSRPEISYATHMCARFCEDPREPHAAAVEHLVRYLKATRDKGIILDPNKKEAFNVYVDADFCGLWNKNTAQDDVSTAKSRTGYIVMYANCPILWASKLQTFITLSTTEAEYVALSSVLRETIVIMNFLKEIEEKGIVEVSHVPDVYCKVFEDNSGALELARVPKMRPRTRHLNLGVHHFLEHVKDGTIHVIPTSSEEQPADIMTKPVEQNLFQKHRHFLMGW